MEQQGSPSSLQALLLIITLLYADTEHDTSKIN